MSTLSLETVTFGNFALLPQQRRLLSHGEPVHVGARAFDVLMALVEAAGQLVSKSQLFERVWPGVVVEENNLQVHVSTLRRILGPDVIATVAGRGYRFVARIFINPQASSGAVEAVAAPQPAVSASVAQRRTVAVLPFVNLGGNKDEEYFSDGLAEDIISHLTRSPWLLVVARNSSFNYRDSALGAERIGQELGARYIVHGTVRRAADKIRMTAELIDTLAHETLWSDRFDRPCADLFTLQDEISARVASAIEPVYLRREELLAGQVKQQDMQHWDMLMRARWHFWRGGREHNALAQTLLRQALELKPDDPSALALMAFTYLTQAWSSWSPDPRGAIAEANRLALSAVRSDDMDPFAHFTLGTALSCTNQMDLAIAELERALALYPQFAGAAGELGRLLVFAGRADEAAEFVLQAIDASPHDPHLSLWERTRALACFVDGQHQEAVRYATRATAKRPDWFFNHFLLAAAQAAAGDLQAANASMATAQAMGPYNRRAMQIGHPFVNPAHMQKFEQALEQAGWRP